MFGYTGRYFNLVCEGACSVSELQAGRPSGSDRVVLRIGENRVTDPIRTDASAEQVGNKVIPLRSSGSNM